MEYPEKRDWRAVPVEKMDRDGLIALIPELAEEMDAIRSQIDKAKSKAAATGEYGDRDWFHRANVALRARGRMHQRIQVRLSQLKKQGKVDNEARVGENLTFERAFMHVARASLPRDTYERILQSTQGRMDDDHSA